MVRGGAKPGEMGEGRMPVLGPIQGQAHLGPFSSDLVLDENRVKSQSRPPKPSDRGPGKGNVHGEIRV